MNWILHPAEPRQLYLAWQAPDYLGERFRWAVGVIQRSGTGATLRYFRRGEEFALLNNGKTYEELEALGFEGYPAFKLRQEVHTEGVLEAFMRRLPPRSRPDFLEFRRQFGLSDSVSLSDFALLGQTEAKLPNDGFSLVDPLDPEIAICDLMLEVAGVRYYVKDTGEIQKAIGASILLAPEPSNRHDSRAVQIIILGTMIGYINRLQAATVGRWLVSRSVSSYLERVDQEREKVRAFIFVRVRPIGQLAAAE